jgi:hypothetical protein
VKQITIQRADDGKSSLYMDGIDNSGDAVLMLTTAIAVITKQGMANQGTKAPASAGAAAAGVAQYSADQIPPVPINGRRRF